LVFLLVLLVFLFLLVVFLFLLFLLVFLFLLVVFLFLLVFLFFLFGFVLAPRRLAAVAPAAGFLLFLVLLFLLPLLLFFLVAAPIGYAAGAAFGFLGDVLFVVDFFNFFLTFFVFTYYFFLIITIVLLLVIVGGNLVFVVVRDALGRSRGPGGLAGRLIDACTAHIDFLSRILSMRITGRVNSVSVLYEGADERSRRDTTLLCV